MGLPVSHPMYKSSTSTSLCFEIFVHPHVHSPSPFAQEFHFASDVTGRMWPTIHSPLTRHLGNVVYSCLSLSVCLSVMTVAQPGLSDLYARDSLQVLQLLQLSHLSIASIPAQSALASAVSTAKEAWILSSR